MQDGKTAVMRASDEENEWDDGKTAAMLASDEENEWDDL